MREISRLAASIAVVGLLHNIVVRELDDQENYEIISGERRFRAFQMLFEESQEKYSTIPCKVEVKIEDTVAEFFLLQANATSSELTDYKIAFQGLRMKSILNELKSTGQLKTLQDKGLVAKGRIRDAIAAMFDVSNGQVSRWESIFSGLSEDFLREFKAEKIGIAMAYDLSLLMPPEQDDIFAEYEANGIDAVKGALGRNQRTDEATSYPSPVDPAQRLEELSHLLEKGINVQKQNHPPRSSHDQAKDMAKPLPSTPVVGTDVHYNALLQLGFETKLNLHYAKDADSRIRFTERFEAFCMVADKFGFDRKGFIDDIDSMIYEMKRNSTD
jgi:hypothetical protein